MRFSGRLALGIAAMGALVACKGEDAGQFQVFERYVSNGALSQGYNGWTTIPAGIQSAANTIKNSATFQYQNFTSTFFSAGGTQHFSLSSAKVQTAHAAGLTGAGQTIAIIDSGFRLTHDELSGKTITPAGTLPQSSHGTAVAAIAAADGTSGVMVGVAPGADLVLGDYTTHSTTTAAVNQAINSGAIAQNNSWGYELDANQQNFNAIFGGSDGQAYIAALQNYAANGVIVFAMSNDQTRNRYDLMGGLPDFVAGIEKSFISVINVTPNVSGGKVQSGVLRSSACHEAARYCMAADGTVKSAIATGDSAYAETTGTSFAAPQVTAAIAVLAQAFPTLSAQELRARLLASADNGFFKHTGYVKFSPSVKHGFNSKFGHGFLDLEAALLPIGSSFARARNGARISVDSPSVLSRGASGDALSRQLSRFDISYSDGMGAGFEAPATLLAAHAVPTGDPVAFLDDHMNGIGQEQAALGRGFGDYLSGEEIKLGAPGTDLALLVPVPGSDSGNLGLSLRSGGAGGVQFGLTGIYETAGLAGITGLEGTRLSSLHGAASVEVSAPLSPQVALSMGARLGVAVPLSQDSDLARFGAASYDELALQMTARDLSLDGDRLALRLALPQAVSGGSANFVLPVSRGVGVAPSYRAVDLSLAPSARQVDLTLDYARPTATGADLILSAGHSMNLGNVQGLRETTLGLGLRVEF